MWLENRTTPSTNSARRPKKRGRSHVAELGGNIILPEIKVPPPKVKGLPLVSGVAPSRSPSPLRLPSIYGSYSSSRCYGSSRCATETPAEASFKSASPCSYISEDSYRGAVPRIMRDAGMLAKILDLQFWVKEAAEVEKLAKSASERGAQMPHVCSVAMAFDVLGRLMQALPQHRHLQLPLLGQLQIAAYYVKDDGGITVVPNLYAALGRISKLPERRTSLLEGFQDDSGDDEEKQQEKDSDEEVDAETKESNTENDAESDTEDSHNSGLDLDDDCDLKGLSKMHHWKKMSLAAEVVAQLSPVETQASLRRADSKGTVLSRGTLFSLASYQLDDDRVKRELIGLQPGEILPTKYETQVPYFCIARRQREVWKQKCNQVAWMKHIAGNVSGLQAVAYRLLGVAMEFTSGRLHKWFFNMWKQVHMTHGALIRQVEGCRDLQRLDTIDLQEHFTTWYDFVCDAAEARLQAEFKERQFEIVVLGDTREALDVRFQHNSQLQQTSVSAISFYEQCLAEHVKGRDARLWKLEFFSPEALKVTMNRLLDRFLGFTCAISDLTWINCKRLVMSKDLAFIIRAEDIAQNVEKMSCELILLRWINYLLGALKRQASDLIELESKDLVTDSRSAWSAKDARQFAARCKTVRLQNHIGNLDEDMKNGVVLTSLSAMLKAVKSQASVFDPADLWPIDIKNQEERAVAIIHCLNAFAPTARSKYFLKPSDIINGNAHALTPFLAAVFLQEAPSDESVPFAKRKTMSVRRATNWFAHEQMEKRLKMLRERQTIRSHANTDENDDSDSESARSSDSDFDDRNKLEQIFLKLEAGSRHLAYDGLVDLSRMLKETEKLTDLYKLEEKELLLRWINVQFAESDNSEESSCEAEVEARAIPNFGEAVKNGRKLLKVILHVIPELEKLYLSTDIEGQTDEQCVQVVLELGPRCVPIFALDAEDIRTGQEDMITCFVGNLFMTCPNLPPNRDSRLWSHRELLEPMARHGYALREGSADPHHWDTLHAFCVQMREQRQPLSIAVGEMLTMLKVFEALHRRMGAFLQRTFEARAQEKMSATKSPKSTTPRYLHADPLRFDFMECMVESEWSNIEGYDSFGSLRDRMRQSIDSCVPLLQNEFMRHSISCRKGELRLRRSGIMRVYGVCRMRCSCLHLPPHVAESICDEIVEDDLPAWWSSDADCADEAESLSIRGFLRWIFRIVLHRYEMLLKEPGVSSGDIDIIETAEHFFRRHIDHFCGQPPDDDEFLRVARDQRVCTLLRTEEKVLKNIFLMYSSEVPSEEVADESGSYHAMTLDEFDKLLADCGLMKASGVRLNHEASRRIFTQILSRGGYADEGRRTCGTVPKSKPQFRQKVKKLQLFAALAPKSQQPALQQSEDVKQHEEAALSFYEFVDAMLVAALHVSPNPLVSLGLRVNSVFMKTVIPALVEHLGNADSKGARQKQRDDLIQTLAIRGAAAVLEKP